MILTYVKLNDYDYTHSQFPYHACGIFCDGIKKYPIVLQLMGEVILETSLPILEADKKCCEILGVKKLPSDVVVQVDNLK